MLKTAYSYIPKSIRNVVVPLYKQLFHSKSPSIGADYIDVFFDGPEEFTKYSQEFDEQVADLQSKRMNEFDNKVPESQGTFGGMEINQARILYAFIRVERPNTIVETGVCNGVSTLVILMALEKNERGKLYSIDYPTFSDEPAPEFQRSQYPKNHTFSTIPKDKEPGWIVPDQLRHRWKLQIGKSQRELPPLLNELGTIDVFIHDSDHTLPCMMFEYELAWEYLHSDGVLLSDDIHANDAFEIFGENRANRYGRACSSLGFALK